MKKNLIFVKIYAKKSNLVFKVANRNNVIFQQQHKNYRYFKRKNDNPVFSHPSNVDVDFRVLTFS